MIGMDVIVGIDPGATSGWAVVTVEMNPKLVLSDSIKWPKPGEKKYNAANIPSAVAVAITEAMRRFDHDIWSVAIEDQYLSRNPDSMKKLARNGGRWEEAWLRLGCPVEWVNTQKWQSAELGTCRVDSAEVKRRAEMKVLGLWKQKISSHAADAALIARFVAIRLAFRRMRPQ